MMELCLQTEPSTLDNPIAETTWQDWFQTWLTASVKEIPPAQTYEVSLRLTDDPAIQAFNAQYRQQNRPTDVLAFAALEVEVPSAVEMASEEALYLGDIIISLETAQRQAQQYDRTITLELAWLAAHGWLHLLGWDHPDDESLEKMLAQQETLLKLVGLVAQS